MGFTETSPIAGNLALKTDHDLIGSGGQIKFSAALFVEFQRRRDIQRGNGDFSIPGTSAPIISASVNEITLDYVFLDFFPVPVTKDKHSVR